MRIGIIKIILAALLIVGKVAFGAQGIVTENIKGVKYGKITLTVPDEGIPTKPCHNNILFSSDSHIAVGALVEFNISFDPDLPQVFATEVQKIADGRVVKGDIKKDILVPAGEIVTITDAKIMGNIRAAGGTLIIKDRAAVKGNIELDNGSQACIRDSYITGDINGKFVMLTGITNSRIQGVLNTKDSLSVFIKDSSFLKNVIQNGNEVILMSNNKINGNLNIVGVSSCRINDNKVEGKTQVGKNCTT